MSTSVPLPVCGSRWRLGWPVQTPFWPGGLPAASCGSSRSRSGLDDRPRVRPDLRLPGLLSVDLLPPHAVLLVCLAAAVAGALLRAGEGGERVSDGRTIWRARDTHWREREWIVILGEEFGAAGPAVIDYLEDQAKLQNDGGRVKTGPRAIARGSFVDVVTVGHVLSRSVTLGLLDEFEDRDGRFTCRVTWFAADQGKAMAANRKAKQRASTPVEPDDPSPLSRSVPPCHRMSHYRTGQDRYLCYAEEHQCRAALGGAGVLRLLAGAVWASPGPAHHRSSRQGRDAAARASAPPRRRPARGDPRRAPGDRRRRPRRVRQRSGQALRRHRVDLPQWFQAGGLHGPRFAPAAGRSRADQRPPGERLGPAAG